MRRGLGLAVATLLLAAAGCRSDGDDTDPTADPTDATAPTAPGDVAPVWDPVVPEQPVDPETVSASYAAVLDDAVDTTDTSSGAEIRWGGPVVTTEAFYDTCVVEVQRTGEGSFSPDPDALREALGATVEAAGFADLAPSPDPGGAVALVATDDADALFEWRSKGETTIAVRVATAPSECQT